MEKLELVKKKEKLLAMIIRNDYICEGVDFIGFRGAWLSGVGRSRNDRGKTGTIFGGCGQKTVCRDIG